MESMEDVQMPRTSIVALNYDDELIAIPRPKTKLVSFERVLLYIGRGGGHIL